MSCVNFAEYQLRKRQRRRKRQQHESGGAAAINPRPSSSSSSSRIFGRCCCGCSIAAGWLKGVAWTSAYGELSELVVIHVCNYLGGCSSSMLLCLLVSRRFTACCLGLFLKTHLTLTFLLLLRCTPRSGLPRARTSLRGPPRRTTRTLGAAASVAEVMGPTFVVVLLLLGINT